MKFKWFTSTGDYEIPHPLPHPTLTYVMGDIYFHKLSTADRLNLCQAWINMGESGWENITGKYGSFKHDIEHPNKTFRVFLNCLTKSSHPSWVSEATWNAYKRLYAKQT
jgi:hypothetical protein